jgi:hypothetical protein
VSHIALDDLAGTDWRVEILEHPIQRNEDDAHGHPAMAVVPPPALDVSSLTSTEATFKTPYEMEAVTI